MVLIPSIKEHTEDTKREETPRIHLLPHQEDVLDALWFCLPHHWPALKTCLQMQSPDDLEHAAVKQKAYCQPVKREFVEVNGDHVFEAKYLEENKFHVPYAEDIFKSNGGFC